MPYTSRPLFTIQGSQRRGLHHEGLRGSAFQAPHCALHISSFREDDSFSGIELPSGFDFSFLWLLQRHLAFLDIFDV